MFTSLKENRTTKKNTWINQETSKKQQLSLCTMNISDSGNEDPIILPCIVNTSINSVLMIDSGASSSFIDLEFCLQEEIPLNKKNKVQYLNLADGSVSKEGAIEFEVTVEITIDQHKEHLILQVIKAGKHPIILGKPWLRQHNPYINWTTNNVFFTDLYCKQHCLPKTDKETSIVETITTLEPPTLELNNMETSLEEAITREGLQDDDLHLYYMDRIRELSRQDEIIFDDDDDIPEEQELRRIIPEEFHDYLTLFSKKKAEKLPPHRPWDHAINLTVSKDKLKHGPVYSLPPKHLKFIKEWIDEMESKDYIERSTASFSSPLFVVDKPEGGLRPVVDYRAINEVTVKDVGSLPLINDSLRHVHTGKIFTKLDLRSAFNLIRIRAGDEDITTFASRYGNYQFKVMPFGLCNAPATCQAFVSNVLRQYLDDFCVCYVDDILVYSKNRQEQIKHVRKILQKLREAGLYLKGEKCEFFKEEVVFLGYVITPDGMEMDKKKVDAVAQWERPTTIKELQRFLGFANFYRRFIKNYAKEASKLYEFLKKDSKSVEGTTLKWTDEHQQVFDKFRKIFCSAPVLKHFDPELVTVIECDASDTVAAGVLSQKHPDVTESSKKKHFLHPVAYFSKKLNSAQCNYPIGDKELLAIVMSFQHWKTELRSCVHPIEVLTDHSNLQTFTKRRFLNRRQVKWGMELADFNFKIIYRPGPKNAKADALTRRSGDLPREGDGRGKIFDSIFQPHNFAKKEEELPRFLAATHTTDASTSLADRIKESLHEDELGKSILKALTEKERRHPKVELANCNHIDGFLLINSRTYVPDNEKLQCDIIRQCHDSLLAGHPGNSATYELVSRKYWWPKMRQTIQRYIKNCETCARIKPVRHGPYGLLKSLEVPEKRWQFVSMDFIGPLPKSESYNMIFVVVDRFSKMAHFSPCTTEIKARGVAKLYLHNIFKLHGVPDKTVSDRGSTFDAEFMRHLCKLLDIDQRFSTAWHPQTDGQTERINAILEQYLRAYCNYQQDNWYDLLPIAEFVYNNTISAGIGGMTPFFANYGYHPRFLPLEDTQTTSLNLEVRDISTKLKEIEKFLKSEMTYAQAINQEQANKKRTTAPNLQIGDDVWLLSRNVKTTRPSKKLDFKKLGPFKVIEKLGSAVYKLDLPHSMKDIHPVFHISLLEPAASNPLEGQQQPPPPPIIIDENPEWEVQEIVDSKLRKFGRSKKKKLFYLVHWKGYAQPTWEPSENLQNSQEALEDFHSRYPSKPGTLDL